MISECLNLFGDLSGMTRREKEEISQKQGCNYSYPFNFYPNDCRCGEIALGGLKTVSL